jgi:hypothetical protein
VGTRTPAGFRLLRQLGDLRLAAGQAAIAMQTMIGTAACRGPVVYWTVTCASYAEENDSGIRPTEPRLIFDPF